LFIVPDDASREKSERAKDNAAGAIARMILKNKAALPLDQVSTLVSFFLKSDGGELKSTRLYVTGLARLF
jgi:hypothetical protein